MKRTILYYPHISVPDNWLKKSLLYWDEIGSIVPRGIGRSAITQGMEYLSQQNIFRYFDPSELTQRRTNAYRELGEEFQNIVNSEKFNKFIWGSRLRPRNSQNFRDVQRNESFSPDFLRSNTALIHRDKASDGLIRFLEGKNLAISHPNQDYTRRLVDNPDSWFLMEKNTAGLYMSLLAKYLADIDINATVSGTDNSYFHGLSYDPFDDLGAFHCYSTTLHDLLPVPSDYASFEDIMNFKNRRTDELSLFRIELQEFQKNLIKAENPTEIKEIAVTFSERLKREINIIKQTMQEANVESQMGTLQTFVKMGIPTLLTGMAGPIMSSLGIAQVPVELSAAAGATVGLINIGTHIISRKNQRQAYLRDNPFSYLYHGASEGII